MIVFLKKIIIFLLPVCLFFVLPVIVIFYGREFYSIDEVIASQKGSPKTIFGFSYVSTLFYPYKKSLLELSKGSITALGTSRVMEIRKEFFIKPDSFVNAGGSVRSLNDAISFIEELPKESSLRVVFIGLDQEMMYEDLNKSIKTEEIWLPRRFINTLVFMSRRMYLDYFAHKYYLSEIVKASMTNSNIGISALINGDGFRYDGSYQYLEAENNKNLVNEANVKIEERADLIRKENNKNYDLENKKLAENLKKLSIFLNLCKAKGITVVGFAPPYPAPIYNAMIERGGIYKDMLTVNIKKEKDVFEASNNIFFDLSSSSIFGGESTEFVDEIHGTDKMYARMMLFMSENNVLLRDYIDTKSLKGLIKNSKNNFLHI